ncbi:hypothetical protein RJ640_021672 [Escallonia rubra]|uniref:Peptidase A1 domain-containing protein n=1 Tax=Escallonia rubra TaxID=112253 RepID=A0AA88QTA2_9ASTE|nr:hypothetical protein RJ640_021672 [Escallonia rubra]
MISPSSCMAAFCDLFSLFCFIQLSVVSFLEASDVGFTVDLLHRDSRLSPFHNPSHTHLDRIHNALNRSISRTIQSQVSSASGEYLMKLSIGTPPVSILGIADTGSDLTWTQCKPCVECFKQISPLFDPRKSRTFKPLACTSPPCLDIGQDGSYCSSKKSCRYILSYGDSSKSLGEVAFETFTFGSTSGKAISIPNVTFGCGHENRFAFKQTASGVIGLGGGKSSIVRQLDKHIKGKFSYCLVHVYKDPSATSKINFGSNAVVSGPGVVSTPLIIEDLYYLKLEGVSVGHERLPYKTSKAGTVQRGNILIDSGTTLTYLPTKFYQSLESALKEAIGSEREPAPDPQGTLSLCYKNGGDLNVPTIRFHFTGADVDLQSSSTFIQVQDDMVCFAMIPSDHAAIFGNLSQMNFLIGYDLVGKKLSFKPTDCSRPQPQPQE